MNKSQQKLLGHNIVTVSVILLVKSEIRFDGL